MTQNPRAEEPTILLPLEKFRTQAYNGAVQPPHHFKQEGSFEVSCLPKSTITPNRDRPWRPHSNRRNFLQNRASTGKILSRYKKSGAGKWESESVTKDLVRAVHQRVSPNPVRNGGMGILAGKVDEDRADGTFLWT